MNGMDVTAHFQVKSQWAIELVLVRKFDNGSRGQVYHINKVRDQLLLGHHRGAFNILDNEVKLIDDEPGGWLFKPLPFQPDLMIEGTYAGLSLHKWQNGQWQYAHKIQGLDESSRVLEWDEEGNLWMTHGYKGVYRLEFDDEKQKVTSLKFYNRDHGFPSNALINVFKINNRLIFTAERGIYRYDEPSDKFVKDEFFTELLGENIQIQVMQEDSFGHIYFVGNQTNGVLRKTGNGNYVLEKDIFNKLRGKLNDDLENVAILNSNNILFGAKEGFIHYDPSKLKDFDLPFNTLIRNVKITSNQDSTIFHGNFVKEGEVFANQTETYRFTLPYKYNSVSFSFSAPYYDGNESMSYQYYLEGFENDWSAWGTNTRKEYTNLKEGDYTLHVRARNIYGRVSAETTYKFAVLPPWYRSSFAYFLYTIAGISVIFISLVLLDRKHKRDKRRMALNQQKELIKKESEIVNITKKSEEEITRLKNEKLESEIAHKNKELGTATMHIINKNEFIGSMKNGLSSVLKKSKVPAVKTELTRLVREIEKNIAEDDDWDNFQIHFDGVHGDFSQRLRNTYPTLSPQEYRLSTYLRMNLSTKEIAKLLNISIRGVEISRYRLRKKLQLERQVNLQEFMLNF
ncbi:MAG: triple tyrosine motif-containing protein [Bacteroidota bacterium]